MSLQPQLLARLEQTLSTIDDQPTPARRLTSDAARLCNRVRKFIAMGLCPGELDLDSLDLASYALQLPARQHRGITAGRLGRTSLRDRCEQAAELLVSLVGQDIDQSLLDRATRLLHEVPARSPTNDAARILADAVNLEDFGLIGLVGQIIQMGLQGDGATEVATAAEKREEYGYWEARLRDGFHFQAVREIAMKRLESARHVMKMLRDELAEDRI